jgi:hypothetical protein
MFSLNGAVRYKYIPNYQDMRGGYDKLCGVIRSLGEDPGKPPIQRKAG